MSTTAELLQAGLACHEAGQLQQAEQHYRQVLAAEPRHAGALHLIGVLALQCGQPDAAVRYISEAIRQSGNQPAFHANLGEAFRALGRLDEAQKSYEQAIALAPSLAAAHNNLGTIHEALGDLPEAVASYRRAIAEQPGYPDAHNNLGIALQKQGDWQAAAECFRRAVESEPRYARGYFNLGVNLATRDQLAEAVQAFEQAIAAAADYAEAHHALGIAQRQSGRLDQARAAFERALELRPAWAEAASSLGALYQKLGDLDAADRMYDRAVAADPNYAEAHYNQGTLFNMRGHAEAAMAKYREAIARKPNFPEAHFNLGTLLQKARRLAEARDAYQEAIRLRPGYSLAHNNLGNVLRELKRFEQATDCYEKALELSPDSADVLVNLGSVWHERGRLDKSLECYQRAQTLNPTSGEVFNNLGTALRELDREAEALACFDRSIERTPDVAEPHYNRALIHLSRERFAEGWPEFASRLRCKNYPRRNFAQPLWKGEPLSSGTLLVHAEQGFGDTIQFARFLPLVRERVEHVVFEVQPQLVPLLTQSGFAEAIASGGDLPRFDAYVPLLHLPSLFVSSTNDLAPGAAYLSADPVRVERWRPRVKQLAGLKIGIAWQGNRDFSADWRRSIPLASFAPLARLPDVSLVSLQRGYGAEQLEAVRASWPILDLAAELDLEGGAFLDTAAVMTQLDLIITSDTAIAHLAGALGAPVWVALPQVPDWRWFRDREDSPWYASMRLFRQQTSGDWEEVFTRIAAAVGHLR